MGMAVCMVDLLEIEMGYGTVGSVATLPLASRIDNRQLGAVAVGFRFRQED
jgi:hypothetical protein